MIIYKAVRNYHNPNGFHYENLKHFKLVVDANKKFLDIQVSFKMI